MASLAYPPSSSAASAQPHRSANYRAPVAVSNAPPGTFAPGTKVQVGGHRVVIEKYLSEGGFAHVYVVRVPREGGKHEVAVLKRVAVPDKENLANMRTEVETMKKLKGHKHIVTYIDSHASQLQGGGYEVFLLMEYCGGGGLIDFMNTRLQHRLTEPEILKIFGDVAEGVACMHYLKPPLLHRDLKVENVLISKPGASSATPTYKLCDFGSTAPPRPAAKTADEGRVIEEDVQKHTTMQYRSPEMIDVWRKQPIDEKADIWALGVLLYKLCYYTTPFEAVGQMAILNASFKYPSYPAFSERLKKLVGSMLKEDPKNRPNIYQVIKEVCSMRGVPVPVKDIYANRTQSEARRNEHLPSSEPVSSPPPVGLTRAAPAPKIQAIPDIAPMRRGRPTAPAQQSPMIKPSASPARGDPFAALDSKSYEVRAGAVDELSSKFPSLEEFAITQGSGGKFPFARPQPKADINKRLADRLADDVFAQAASAKDNAAAQPPPRTTSLPQTASPEKPKNISVRKLENVQHPPLVYQPKPLRPGYTSTGTMTSPPPSPPPASKLPDIAKRPIWRLPEHHRASSQPRASESAQAAASSLQPSLPPAQRPALLDIHRSKSQTATVALKSPTSSRPSLEGHRPPMLDANEAITRAKSANSRQRPSSAYVSSNLDYLRDQESARKLPPRESESRSKRPSMEGRRLSRQATGNDEEAVDDVRIANDTDYLRSLEDNDGITRISSRKGNSGHKKRSSLPSISLLGTKNMIAGRFGDALKRFDASEGKSSDQAPRTPSPQPDDRILSPIEGSEATPSKHSDPGSAIDETEDLPPDVRRELERRRLSQEERRVAEAAAEYRNRVAGAGGAPQTRASTIQNRVQSLLEQGRQSPVAKRSAEGYGRYTEPAELEATPAQPPEPVERTMHPPVAVSRKPVISNTPSAGLPYQKTRQQPMMPPEPSMPTPSSSAPPAQPRIMSRPSAPPKPKALRTGGQWPPAANTDKPLPQQPTSQRSGLAALLAKDLEGVPDYPPSAGSGTSSLRAPDSAGDADLEAEFSQRYPSLSGIEMVETDVSGAGGERRAIRIRDV